MRVRGGVVGGHDQHPAAAPGADPVLGERDRLRGARAGGVDLGVRPARPDQLGELRVAHREDAEEEPAVEGVRLLLELALAGRGCAARPRRAPPDRCRRGRASWRAATRARRGARGACGPWCSAPPRRRSPRGRGRPRRRSPRCRRAARPEATSGRAAWCPWSWSCSAARAGCPASRSASMPAAIASCVSRPSAASRSSSTPNSSTRSNAPARAGELDHVLEVVDRLERGAAVVALDQARDVLVEHLAAQAARDHVDDLLAVAGGARCSRRRRAARRRAARAPRR